MALDQNRAAEDLALAFAYNVEALRYQRDRREAGSFTTTLAGSADEYRLYARAWAIAVSREANATGSPT